jgi:hypothetical protein
MSLREEQLGKIFMGGGKENYAPGQRNNLILPENQILIDAQKQREAKEAEEARAMYLDLQAKKQADLEARLQTLELVPMGAKVVLLPYPRNPYKKVMNGKIIVEYNGEFNNPDSGEKDTLNVFVGCAQVIEIGPECKYVKPGDDIYYDTRTCYPLPFMSLGYILTTEPQILAVINDGLKTRFKME